MTLKPLLIATHGLLSQVVPSLLALAMQGLIDDDDDETPVPPPLPPGQTWLLGMALAERQPLRLDPMQISIHAVGGGFF